MNAEVNGQFIGGIRSNKSFNVQKQLSEIISEILRLLQFFILYLKNIFIFTMAIGMKSDRDSVQFDHLK